MACDPGELSKDAPENRRRSARASGSDPAGRRQSLTPTPDGWAEGAAPELASASELLRLAQELQHVQEGRAAPNAQLISALQALNSSSNAPTLAVLPSGWAEQRTEDD